MKISKIERKKDKIQVCIEEEEKYHCKNSSAVAMEKLVVKRTFFSFLGFISGRTEPEHISTCCSLVRTWTSSCVFIVVARKSRRRRHFIESAFITLALAKIFSIYFIAIFGLRFLHTHARKFILGEIWNICLKKKERKQ